MYEHRSNPSSSGVAIDIASASVGLGILTMTLFPLSLGGLLIFVIAPAVILIAPLVLLPLLAALLAAPFILLFRLARALTAKRPSKGGPRHRRTKGRTWIGREEAVRYRS